MQTLYKRFEYAVKFITELGIGNQVIAWLQTVVFDMIHLKFIKP